MRAVGTGLLFLTLLGGCGAPPSPRTALDAWGAALARDDAHAAWRLLSAEERRRTPWPDFERRWRQAADERAALRGAEPRVVQERAIIVRHDRTIGLVREGGAWRLETPRASDPGARSLPDLLEALARAVERRDGAAFLQLLSPGLKAAVERELADRAAGLRELAQRPLPDGTRLRLRYGSRFWVELERTDAGWRIVDLN